MSYNINEILTGPKGGKYYLRSDGGKIYIPKHKIKKPLKCLYDCYGAWCHSCNIKKSRLCLCHTCKKTPLSPLCKCPECHQKYWKYKDNNSSEKHQGLTKEEQDFFVSFLRYKTRGNGVPPWFKAWYRNDASKDPLFTGRTKPTMTQEQEDFARRFFNSSRQERYQQRATVIQARERDSYEILCVKSTATTADIKKAYRLLAIKYHPDRNPEGEERMKEINGAYNLLVRER